MFRNEIKINSKDHFMCNLYYLKRYFGVKEIVFLSVLLVAGILLFLWQRSPLIIALWGVTLILVIGSLLAFLITSKMGYKAEFTKRQATKWKLSFNELGFNVETYEKGGEVVYPEKHLFADLDRVAILKDKVYIYVNSAVMYYIRFDTFTEGNFIEFCAFLKEKVEPIKFKMKAKRKQFPYGR